MKILINASNLRKGGGIQVAESLISELHRYPQHQFVVVYSDALSNSVDQMSPFDNIVSIKYNLPSNVLLNLTGRNSFLDNLVEEKRIDTVLTVFGPSRWRPKVTHVCGFARAQMVLESSPYWGVIGYKVRIRYFFRKRLLKMAFDRSAKVLWSESSYISDLLKKTYPSKRVYTVTNNYNQVFDEPEKWDRTITIPHNEGLTFLTISANYPHKNLSIIIPTVHYLKSKYPELKFRFVLTIRECEFPKLDESMKGFVEFLGPVTIGQCPYLYEQCDVMLLPSLLECFSANYAEAMRMGKPILTTNLDFAKALCGDAAIYYGAIDPRDLGEAIYLLSKDKNLRKHLVENGYKQLSQFDSYETRAKKLIEIVENEFSIQRHEES